MSKKINRATHGPGWGEVIFGAVLSAVLGVVLGVVVLVTKPVVSVKELPKPEERVRGTVYYVEGAQGGNAKQALAKRKAFVEGQSVTVTEAEINALASPAGPAGAATPPPKSGEKAKAPEKAKAGEKAAPATPSSGEMLAKGPPNVRLRGGVMQVGLPVTLNVLGQSQKVLVQARGQFVKDGDVFAYHADELYFGSCPVQRLPYLSSYVHNKFLNAQAIPEDIATAWRKLANVAIEENALKLTMP